MWFDSPHDLISANKAQPEIARCPNVNNPLDDYGDRVRPKRCDSWQCWIHGRHKSSKWSKKIQKSINAIRQLSEPLYFVTLKYKHGFDGYSDIDGHIALGKFKNAVNGFIRSLKWYCDYPYGVSYIFVFSVSDDDVIHSHGITNYMPDVEVNQNSQRKYGTALTTSITHDDLEIDVAYISDGPNDVANVCNYLAENIHFNTIPMHGHIFTTSDGFYKLPDVSYLVYTRGVFRNNKPLLVQRSNIPKKRCPICNQVKSLTHYQKSGTNADGTQRYRNECKECTHAKDRERDDKRKHDLKRKVQRAVNTANRRAIAAGIDGVLSWECVMDDLERRGLIVHVDGLIVGVIDEYTSDVVSISELSIDHLQAFSNGGKNTIDNIRWCSEKINTAKGSKTVRQWKMWLHCNRKKYIDGVPVQLSYLE